MKKLFLTSAFVFLFAFAFTTFAQQVESGTFSASKSTANYTLDKNTGVRFVTIPISYDKSFEKKPHIIITVDKIDADKSANLRYEVKAVSVSRDNFTVSIQTWADSKIFAISGTWLAISE